MLDLFFVLVAILFFFAAWPSRGPVTSCESFP